MPRKPTPRFDGSAPLPEEVMAQHEAPAPPPPPPPPPPGGAPKADKSAAPERKGPKPLLPELGPRPKKPTLDYLNRENKVLRERLRLQVESGDTPADDKKAQVYLAVAALCVVLIDFLSYRMGREPIDREVAENFGRETAKTLDAYGVLPTSGDAKWAGMAMAGVSVAVAVSQAPKVEDSAARLAAYEDRPSAMPLAVVNALERSRKRKEAAAPAPAEDAAVQAAE